MHSKLSTEEGILLKLPFLCEATNDLSILPAVSIFDLYNYLRNCKEFNHVSMRDFEKNGGPPNVP